MKIKSIIPARSGSKGIPNKNIANLNGKPLLYYTINASLHSMVGLETYVSSDSDEILNVAQQLGAQTIKRPSEISQDKSKSEETLLHFLDQQECDILVFIQPTSPLLLPKHINQAIDYLLQNTQLNSAFTVFKEHWLPRWSANRQPVNWDINARPMRQDVEEQYVENGACYVSRADIVKKTKLRYSYPIEFVVMENHESFQVDTYDDFYLVSKLLS